jgi:hypothetical protein
VSYSRTYILFARDINELYPLLVPLDSLLGLSVVGLIVMVLAFSATYSLYLTIDIFFLPLRAFSTNCFFNLLDSLVSFKLLDFNSILADICG